MFKLIRKYTQFCAQFICFSVLMLVEYITNRFTHNVTITSTYFSESDRDTDEDTVSISKQINGQCPRFQ